MSAEVMPSTWGWWCAECGDGSGAWGTTEHQAALDAAAHDERNH